MESESHISRNERHELPKIIMIIMVMILIMIFSKLHAIQYFVYFYNHTPLW